MNNILVVSDNPEGWQQQREFFRQANRLPMPSIVIVNDRRPLLYWQWESRPANPNKIREVSHHMNKICSRYKSGSIVRNGGRAFQIGVTGFEIVKGFKNLTECQAIAEEMQTIAQNLLQPNLNNV